VSVKLVSTTLPSRDLKDYGVYSGEDLMVYAARVSSPQNQHDTATGERLLRYCIKHGHWSVFDMADMTVEVQTSRAISAQVVRHWSFDGLEVSGDFRFQEFSQRYAPVAGFETYEARAPHPKNRQLSVDTLSESAKVRFQQQQEHVQTICNSLYLEALELGIAKECARFLLPMSAATTFYMKGSVRSWIHYLKQRSPACGAEGVQPEHGEIADRIAFLFAEQFPLTYKAAFNEQA